MGSIMNRLSNEELQKLVELEKEATQGTWHGDYYVMSKEEKVSKVFQENIDWFENANLIVKLRNAAPSILSELMELRNIVNKTQSAIERRLASDDVCGHP